MYHCLYFLAGIGWESQQIVLVTSCFPPDFDFKEVWSQPIRGENENETTWLAKSTVKRMEDPTFCTKLLLGAGSARHRLLTCEPESWQTWFYLYLPDGFFLWTLFNFGAPIVRFGRVMDFLQRGDVIRDVTFIRWPTSPLSSSSVTSSPTGRKNFCLILASVPTSWLKLGKTPRLLALVFQVPQNVTSGESHQVVSTSGRPIHLVDTPELIDWVSPSICVVSLSSSFRRRRDVYALVSWLPCQFLRCQFLAHSGEGTRRVIMNVLILSPASDHTSLLSGFHKKLASRHFLVTRCIGWLAKSC